jgi:hypothetical protein
MAINKRLLVKPPSTGLTPSEHFGAVLYEGDNATSRSINGGKFGAGAYFNGSSSYISRDSGFLPMGDAARSFSFWVMVNSLDTDQYFLSYGDGATGQFFSPRIRPVSQGSYIGFMGYAADIDSNVVMTTGEWMHLCYTYDGTTLKIYKNATEIASGSLSLNTSTTRDFIIGARDYNGSITKRMDGKLDQLRIFSKALSSSEVSTLYAETTPESLDPLSEDTTDTLQVLSDSSCIAAYQFENNEDDLSGNYDGTGTEIQYAAGRYGQAGDFNGSTSEVTTSDMTGLDSTTISLSAWVYFDAVGVENTILSRFGGCGNHSCYQIILRTTSSNIWSFATYDGTGSGNSLTSTDTVTTGTWYHVVIVADGTSKKIYVNNEQVASNTVSFSVNTSSGEGLNIGGRGDFSASSTSRMNGRIDQVRTFNKALSASEVTTLYNENSLVASYRFEGNANDDMRAYDGTASNVTYEYGLNFTPDLVWIKDRSNAEQHILNDSTRGASYDLSTNTTGAQVNRTTGFLSFDTGGFTLGSDGGGVVNDATRGPYVAWAWKANGGTTTSATTTEATNGTYQANVDAGFSIVTFTTSNSTVQPPPLNYCEHGLGVAPSIVIYKETNDGGPWQVNVPFISNNGSLQLNTTDAMSSGFAYDFFDSDSTNIAIRSNYAISRNVNLVAYVFAEVEGFSKFGTYSGNGSADGPIIETGFEPAFVILKSTTLTTAGSYWSMYDNKRNTTNPKDLVIRANDSAVEITPSVNPNLSVNFLSNGFQIVGNYDGINGSGHSYIYMAFAADPDTEAPTVAKSFTTVAYTGNGSTQTIDGLGFKPGLIWMKRRDTAQEHALVNIVSGPLKHLYSDLTNAEVTTTNGVSSFNDDGWTMGANGLMNNTNNTYVGWAWKADDNEPTINTEGTIDTVVSANANAGFSIVNWTGGSSGTATTGHGLSAAPELIIQRPINATSDWFIWHKDLTSGNSLRFTTAAESTAIAFTVNSTLFYTNWTNTSYNWIAYCFHSVSGYSKIGSYAGNGTSQTVTLGFRPDFVILRKYDDTQDWFIFDSVRGDTQPFDARLKANSSGAETTSDTNIYATDTGLNFSSASFNDSGKNFIYAAFKIN